MGLVQCGNLHLACRILHVFLHILGTDGEYSLRYFIDKFLFQISYRILAISTEPLWEDRSACKAANIVMVLANVHLRCDPAFNRSAAFQFMSRDEIILAVFILSRWVFTFASSAHLIVCGSRRVNLLFLRITPGSFFKFVYLILTPEEWYR